LAHCFKVMQRYAKVGERYAKRPRHRRGLFLQTNQTKDNLT
jgi:hypothetical protein